MHKYDLVFYSREYEETAEKFRWKSEHESKGMEVKLAKTKVMVSKISRINKKPYKEVGPCDICCRHGEWDIMQVLRNRIYEKLAKMKRMTSRFAIYFQCSKCKRCHKNVDQNEKVHVNAEIVMEFSYPWKGINT